MAIRDRDVKEGPGSDELAPLVQAAQAGDRDALETVVRAIQNDIYGLALRFLWHPDDAEDATQEILVRVVTRLGTFRSESRFRTWVFRVATNTLLNFRRSRAEEERLTFVRFGQELEDDDGLDVPAREPAPDHALLLKEVRVGCTLGMLLCLNRGSRMAYILGAVLELDHREGAAVLNITPAAFRQRLARARRRINRFMTGHCGHVNPEAACRCEKRVGPAVKKGRVTPSRLLFAGAQHGQHVSQDALRTIRRLESAQRDVALYRAHTPTLGDTDFGEWVRELIDRALDSSQAGRARHRALRARVRHEMPS